MKILINTPNYKQPYLGGVANHFYGLLPYWTENVKYNVIARRHGLSGAVWMPWDIIKFILRILLWQPDVVMINPSLGKTAIKRDCLFMDIAHALGKKVVVHFHGFNVYYAKEVDPDWFVKKFRHATSFIVLNGVARDQIRAWGCKQPIYMGCTKVDDRMVEGYDVKKRNNSINHVLYLGRVEKEKGIYISLDVYALLQDKYPDLKFTVVGNGSEFEKAKQYASEKGIRNITFTGALSGDALINQFKQADLYLFTSYHEGMPTSVLEAMCFGLPVVTRPVGGLVDMFENEKMGYMIDSFDAKGFVDPILSLISKPEKVAEIINYNYEYGKEHFMASKIALSIEQILKKSI